MNKIDVLNIEDNLNKLLKLEEKYESCYLNYYKVLDDLISHWISQKSYDFFEKVAEEKKKQITIIENIKEINNIYNCIKSKYKRMGNKVCFDSYNINKLVTNTNRCFNKLKNIIYLYDDINLLNLSNEQRNILVEEVKKMNKNLENINSLKSVLVNKSEILEETEKNLKLKISKIGIGTAGSLSKNEIFVKKSYNYNYSEIVIKKEEIEKSFELLNMYKNEEELLVENFDECYININKFYKTSNTNSLEKLERELINSMNNMLKSHSDNIEYLKQEKIMVEELERKSIQIILE